jgi:hypothetical protein
MGIDKNLVKAIPRGRRRHGGGSGGVRRRRRKEGVLCWINKGEKP